MSLLELVAAPDDAAAGHQHRIVLDTSQGGRATSWKFDDLELLGRYNDHWVGHGMYPMAPWAGRLRGNALLDGATVLTMPVNFQEWAIHGLVAESPVQVDQVAAHQAELTYSLGAPWPWSGQVRMSWILEPAELRTQIQISSDEAAFPVVVGWHPWFRRQLSRGGPAFWELPGGKLAPRDADRMPTNLLRPATMADGPFDDAFWAPGEARLCWPGALTLHMHNSAPWFVIFDELQDFVLIEPQSGPPNGLNDPLVGPLSVVEPGSPLVHQVTWSLQHDQHDRPVDPA